MKPFLIFIVLCFLPCFADAQTKQKFTIRDGKLVGGTLPNTGNSSQNSRGISVSESQKIIFKAQESLIKGDLATAEALYSEAISRDGSNVQAYLHRGVVRRERGDYRGVDSDARMAVTLANSAIQANPRDSDAYYDRSLALRLLRQFDLAKKDIHTAIQLGGKPSLKNDLQAIELERKMALSAAQTMAR